MTQHTKIHTSDSPLKEQSPRVKFQMPFTRTNFIMMGCCLAMIIIGFLLMSGGGSASQTEFNPEIFSTRRIVVGPTITFLGFLLMAFAIIWTPKKKNEELRTKNE